MRPRTAHKQHNKRAIATTQSTRANRWCLSEQPMDSMDSSSGDDFEVFDDKPLTRTGIPKMVEAAMYQFPSIPKEGANWQRPED